MGPGQVIGYEVRMVCRRCGNQSQRSADYLKAKYGAENLAAVGRRARCLRYIKGARCNGMASVSWVEVREKRSRPSD